MLARKLFTVKRNLLITLTIFITASLTGYYLYNQPNIPLLSPLLRQTAPPDLTNKLNQKLSSPPELDYQAVSTPEGTPKYVSYLLYQPRTGRVYASNNEDIRLSPASFTKLMTAMVALDIALPTQLLSATKETIDKEPTILGLKENEQLSILELIRGAISTSANDAAATLAEGTASIYGQDTDYFIFLMNQKAQLMSLKDTHFQNPEGYDDHNQYSTLEDLSTLIHNVQQNYPDIADAGSADREDLAATSTHGFYYLPNWNGLLNIYPGVTGLKIAYTENASYSTIITATREDAPINLILIGAKSIKERDQLAASLLDFAYQKEKIKAARITEKDLQKKYDQWKELAEKIKAELAALEASKSSLQNEP